MSDFLNTYKIPIRAVVESSKVIMEIYQRDFKRIQKEDGSPVTEADLESSKIINQYLSKTGIPVTGEELEKAEFKERASWTRSWCVDPLDGTKEFIRKNGEFVVNIALIENGCPVFGVIASPVNQKIIAGNQESGAFEFSFEDVDDMTKWRKLPNLKPVESPVNVISSRSHFSGNILRLVEDIQQKYGPIETAKMGSALKFFELVNERANVYPRFAPTMEWDIAAGQAIYEAIGGKIIDVHTGKPLIYNKKDLRNPHFVAFNGNMDVSVSSLQTP
jgi:3'(2'), 5'-bisphosphate nucleotidase